MIIVLANGCFDPLHPGHVLHLQAAKQMGDRLIVGLTSDEWVTKAKGEKRPYLTWIERSIMISALECVDAVMEAGTAPDLIRLVRPSIYVKGDDWAQSMPDATTQACYEVGAQIRYTDTPRFGVSEFVRRLTK